MMKQIKFSQQLVAYASLRMRIFRMRQKGVILLITLIAMVILLISGIALVRSFDTSLVLAGNLSFKRDLVNQGDRGFSAAVASFNGAGFLANFMARQSDSLANNYSSTMLASDAHGLPLMLTNDSLWTMTIPDIVDNTTGVTIRYVIDRMCNITGPSNPNNCIVNTLTIVKGGTAGIQKPTPTNPIVYRISVRVTGPRNTQSYMQSTFSL